MNFLVMNRGINKMIGVFSNRLALMRWKRYSEKLSRFKNMHLGEDCFIIGNGPSLNEIDLNRLNDFHTIGLNKIFLIFSKVNLELSYHVAVNPYVIAQSVEEINNLKCPSFLSYTSAVKNGVFGNNIFFLGDMFPNQLFYKDLTEGVRQGHTVTFVAMQLAYYMGFKRVFLVGVDHNFFQDGQPNEKQLMSSEDLNHFDPNYFKGMEWQLADLEGSEMSYLIAKYQFERNGRIILDATKGGKLEVFDKLSFNESINMARKKNA